MAQIETPKGLANLDAIAAVDGVDVIFFGPNDFAANSGLLGQPGHADVIAKMEAGMKRVRELGKVSGILCGEPQVDRYMKAGTPGDCGRLGGRPAGARRGRSGQAAERACRR